MKRFILLAAAGLLAIAISPHHAWAFGWKDVLEMHQDGVSDELILEKIEHGGKTFHLDADDIHDLKEAGVSDRVISAMLRTEDQNDDGYYDGYAHAYPRTRVFVGLGFGSPFYDYYYPRPFFRGYYPRHVFYAPRFHGGYHGGWRGRR